MEALVVLACEIYFAEKNLPLSHADLVQKKLADALEGKLTEAELKKADKDKLHRLRIIATNILHSIPQGPAREETLSYVREHAGVFARHIELLRDQAGKEDAPKS